jgi:uncharacterized protein YbaR (Trm112 family)
MGEKTERRMSYADLRHLVFVCPSCRVEVTIDAANESLHDGSILWDTPLACPICRRAFDRSIAESLHAFVLWYAHVKQSGQPVFFRVEVA